VSITHINSLSACPVDDWKPVEDQHQANAMPRGGLVASRSDAAHGFYQRFYSMHFSIARSLGGRASSLPTRTVVFLVLGRSAAHQSARRTISSSSCIFTVVDASSSKLIKRRGFLWPATAARARSPCSLFVEHENAIGVAPSARMNSPHRYSQFKSASHQLLLLTTVYDGRKTYTFSNVNSIFRVRNRHNRWQSASPLVRQVSSF